MQHERAINVFSTVLLDTLRSNPALVGYLMTVTASMCSQPYCGRKAVYGGRCDVHRRAHPKEISDVR